MAHNKLTPDSYDYNFSNYVSVPLSAFREQTITWRGHSHLVIALSDAAFRDWFYAVLDLLEVRSLSNEIQILRRECRSERMDEDARWYFINEVLRLRRYRTSRVNIWTVDPPRSRGKVAAKNFADLKDVVALIQRHGDVLSEHERQIVSLFFGLHGPKMRGTDIAALYGITKSATYLARKRALEKIRRAMHQEVA